MRGRYFWYTRCCVPPLQFGGIAKCLHSFSSTFERPSIPVVRCLLNYSSLEGQGPLMCPLGGGGGKVASYPGRSLIKKKRPGNLSKFKLLTSAALELAVPIRFQNTSRDSCGISLRHKYITVQYKRIYS